MLWIKKPFTKIACISDPHAHLETLKALIAKIPADYTIIILGDMIDKGKNAKGVVDLVMNNYEALLGNHDLLMTIEHHPRYWKRYQSLWLINNGKDTHKSYGDKWKILNIQENKIKFHEHVRYLKTLPLVIELPNLLVNNKPVILSHSTISQAVTHYGSIEKLKEVLKTRKREEFLLDHAEKNEVSEREVIQSILWTVVDDVNSLPNQGCFNVIGHTVQDKGIQIGENGAAIDCGVYLHKKMSALLLPDLTIIEQEALPD